MSEVCRESRGGVHILTSSPLPGDGPATEEQVEVAAAKAGRYRALADEWEAETARLLATRKRRGWRWGFMGRVADRMGMRTDALSKRVTAAGAKRGG